MSESPQDIYQRLLDDSAQACLDGNIDELFQFAKLPLRHNRQNESVLLETMDDFALARIAYSKSLKARGANQYIRLTTDAEFLGEDYIQGQHVTHILRNATPVVDPFVCRMVLKRADQTWKVTEIESPLIGGTWPLTLLRLPDDPMTPKLGLEDDARRKSAEPLGLYQTYLNGLTQANVTHDFDAYIKMFAFPYSTHGSAHDVVIQSPEEVKPFFDMQSAMIRDNKLDDFLRIADHAEFIAGDQICGYHTTRFLRDGQDTLEPIKSRMILRRTGVRWFAETVTNSVSNTEFPYNAPQTESDLVTHRKIQERTKTWPNLH